MNVVVAVEEGPCRQLKPTKIKLAALGNAVAQLYWATPQREPAVQKLPQLAFQCEQVNRRLAEKLAS